MAPTTHTETHPLVFGQEVSFGTIAGPVDFVDVYADGNPASNAVVEWRVYATVGALVSRVAAGAAGGKQASVIKWSGPQGQYSPIAANGSTYELRAYWAQAGIPPTMKASIVGYDQFDTVADGDGSASEQVPGGFGEVDLVTEDGYSQFADAAVTQSFQGAVRFTLYALSEATTGIEAAIDSVDLINPQDSTTRIFSNVKLPGAVSYTLRANNISTTGVGPTIAASLACYSTAAQSPGGIVLTPLAGDIGVSGPANANQIAPTSADTQIDVIRSNGTKAVWASSGYIDLVADCGADPTGVVSSSPAFDQAFVLLSTLAANTKLPETSLVLFIPPGTYSIDTALMTPTWDFLNKTTSLRIQGAGADTSILAFSGGNNGPIIANLYRLFIEDITCIGVQNNVLGDCGVCFVASANDLAVMERCNFFNLVATIAVVKIENCAWAIRDCDFANCGNTNPLAGVLWSVQSPSVQLENCTFPDVGKVNGFIGITKAASNLGPWFRHDDSVAVGNIQHLIRVVGCFFDETALGGILVHGGPTRNIPYVNIEGCLFNPSSLGAANSPDISLTNVEDALVTGIVDTGFNPTDTGPIVACFSVARTRLEKIVPNNAALSNTVTADAACGLFEVVESPTLLTSNIISAASRTTVDNGGIMSDVLPIANNVTAGLLLKIANSGGNAAYTPLLTTDLVGNVASIALDTKTTPGQVRGGRIGQRLPNVLQDGANAIAIGDEVTVSAVSAGRITKNVAGSSIVGTAMTAAPAVADTTVDVLFIPS